MSQLTASQSKIKRNKVELRIDQNQNRSGKKTINR